jgi:wyosine [tRNA(Phe)-imidazoG37] synthetase (radical SAM superfamily)
MPFDVTYKEDKNRLYYDIDGYVSNEDVEKIMEAMDDFLAERDNMFTAIIDMKDFKVSEDIKEAVKSIQQVIKSGKLIADAFIVSQSAIGKMQFEQIEEETKARTRRKIFSNQTEAEKWLDSVA